MRLSEWRRAAPNREAGSARIPAIVDPVLTALGAGDDPHGWIAWGEEPGTRYTMLIPTAAGLISAFVRVNVAGEGPRVSAKLVRWSRVQTGELAFETSAGHRLLSFQVEGNVLNGADDVADRIAAFALEVFAAIDGRPRPEPPSRPRRASAAKARPSGSNARSASSGASSASARAARGRPTGSGR